MVRRPFAVAAVFAAACSAVMAAEFPWQNPHAQVLPNGDLKLTQKPFVFMAGESVRYIDFAGGNDNNTGQSKDAAWKHHPWDPSAQGKAKASKGSHTYVFKRGVAYRGVLRPEADKGTAQQPIRLTSDPGWGNGDAAIYGSELVTGWQRQGHPDMPQGDRVWSAEVNFVPMTLWMTGGKEITRLTLARWPNWKESDPNDLMREWPTWENPEWWKNNSKFHIIKVDGKDRHAGIDTKNFTRPAADYVGATVWSEWGIVMGSPYPAVVEAFDEKQKAVAFRGPWTYDMLEIIIRGNRYHLENKPWMLDEPGEFWVERQGDNRSRIYVRLPEDRDPNTIAIEAGRHYNILDAKELSHVQISGLTFRFSNVHWRYNEPQWAHPDLQAAVIRLNGSGDGIQINNNLFEHVNQPIRMAVGGTSARIGTVAVTDNTMRYTDSGAAYIRSSMGNDKDKYGPVEHVDFLRNDLFHIGWRNLSGEHGHAVDLTHPITSHVAGNNLYRIAGWGISVTGGKNSHGDERNYGAPLSRHLVHHNRVEDVLLKSNDWGGIETWQGGPFYIYSNIVINPVAFKHWTWREGEKDNIGSFGHAFYHDGGFKNYLFNNIAAGRNNTLGTRSVNTTALQNIFSFENWFFNNTFYRFAEQTRQQSPAAGRFRYLGNIIEDTSRFVFRHTDPQDVAPDPNASHYKTAGKYAYNTLAYSQNVFADVKGRFGAFEETGVVYPTADEFGAALKRVNPQAGDLGVTAPKSVLKDPQKRDFRPAAGSAATQQDVLVFVPWSLYATVGEWQFTRNNADPAQVIDEHWYMTSQYRSRERYMDTPRYPLQGVNIAAANYVAGSDSNWTTGAALQLDGRAQHLVLPHAKVAMEEPAAAAKPAAGAATTMTELPFAKVQTPSQITPGRPFEVIVEFKEPIAQGQRADLHIHWLKSDGWGGFAGLGGNAEPVQGRANTFRFRPTVQMQEGLAQYSLLVFTSADGSWDKRTLNGSFAVPLASDAPKTIGAAGRQTVDMQQNNFIIEAILKTQDGDGVVVQKMGPSAGYAVELSGGKPVVRLKASGGELVATAGSSIADGKWHHLLVEVDRKAGVKLYMDGKLAAANVTGKMPEGSLTNPSDFTVGGAQGAEHLAATFDFLRVTRGTLADSKTTIEELYAWQTDGPQYRDFAGNDRRKRNAAGALAVP